MFHFQIGCDDLFRLTLNLLVIGCLNTCTIFITGTIVHWYDPWYDYWVIIVPPHTRYSDLFFIWEFNKTKCFDVNVCTCYPQHTLTRHVNFFCGGDHCRLIPFPFPSLPSSVSLPLSLSLSLSLLSLSLSLSSSSLPPFLIHVIKHIPNL